MRLAEVTWTDADESEADVALLPVGSTEQHGPHAPLGTDVLTAEAVAEAGAEAADRPVVVGPTVPVGVAAEHRQFTGTCWVSPDTFRAYVGETVESLASHGWDRVVVVNGHGGNVDALSELCARLYREEAAYAVPFTWFDAIDLDAATPAGESLDMGHGGAAETSLISHVEPDLVHEERFESAAADAAETWGEWVAGVNLEYDSAAFSKNGAVGDPRDSDSAIGEALLEASADALARVIATLADRSADPPDHR